MDRRFVFWLAPSLFTLTLAGCEKKEAGTTTFRLAFSSSWSPCFRCIGKVRKTGLGKQSLTKGRESNVHKTS